MKEHVLILGNGLNRLTGQVSWDDLIQNLNMQFAHGKVNVNGKPFPLLYEEIVSRARENQYPEENILTEIAKTAKKISYGDYHNVIVKKFRRILTTNYDYALEKAISPLSDHFDTKTRERRYSLKRKVEIDQNEIWHIHGESENPNTICLGYDHYSGYLQNIRAYLTSPRGTGIVKTTIANRIRNKIVDQDTWMETLFICDISIVGLDLSFVEFELWWLLVYRQRLKQQKSVPIDNQIVYYHRTLKDDGNQSKLELLSALGVTIESIKSKSYVSFYDEVINRITR